MPQNVDKISQIKKKFIYDTQSQCYIIPSLYEKRIRECERDNAQQQKLHNCNNIGEINMI